MNAFDNLFAELRQYLIDSGYHLSCAESVTAGNIQSFLASRSGASDFFVGGITAYNIDQKVKHLGVDRAHAGCCDCVSATVAKQMAEGVKIMFGTEFSIATTGYAEPYSEASITRPFAWVAIACPNRETVCVRVDDIKNGTERKVVQCQFALEAIEFAAKTILQR